MTKNELIDKWGFRLALYTFVSMFLVVLIFNVLPPDVADNSIGVLVRCVLFVLILLPCFLGGILYLYLGAKFRSSICLSVGSAALLIVVSLSWVIYFPPSSTQDNGIRIYGFIVLLSFFLLILRRQQMGLDKPIEKWGKRLTEFTMFVPLFALPVILFPHLLPKNFETRNLLMYLFLMLMSPSIVGGIFYLGIGTISKSSKLASVGLSSLQLTLTNFVVLFGVFTMLFNNMG